MFEVIKPIAFPATTLCTLSCASLMWALSFYATAADYQDRQNMCLACHGEVGTNPFPSIPNLKWQNREYLINQLNTFKSGEREDITMTKVAQLLSEDDIQQLADYFYNVKAEDNNDNK